MPQQPRARVDPEPQEDGDLDMIDANPRSPVVHGRCHNQEQALLEDIAYCEARLRQMGHLGDCAYEKAMTRFYEALVEEKRQSLERIRSGRPAAAVA
jgi:hypothetical protein